MWRASGCPSSHTVISAHSSSSSRLCSSALDVLSCSSAPYQWPPRSSDHTAYVRFCCVLHAITVQSASQSVGVCNTSRHPHMGVASSRQEEAIASSWILQNKKKTTRLINCLVCRKLRGGRLVEVQRKSEGRKEKFSGALPLCARIRAPSLSIFFLRL